MCKHKNELFFLQLVLIDLISFCKLKKTCCYRVTVRILIYIKIINLSQSYVT